MPMAHAYKGGYRETNIQNVTFEQHAIIRKKYNILQL